jgi:MarR family 2-MHQ and catechol resistance regulon transcriptional repressor
MSTRTAKKSPIKAARPVHTTAAHAPVAVDERYAEELKLWVVLARAAAAVGRHSDADISRHGLSSAEFGILEAIYHKGPMLLGEIQRRILVSSGGITFLVDRLTEKGLVAREACPNDRRARYAVLTPAGRALLKRIFPEHAEVIAQALGGLTRDQRRAATKLLRDLGRSAAEKATSGTD